MWKLWTSTKTALVIVLFTGIMAGCGSDPVVPEPAGTTSEEASAVAEHLGAYLATQTAAESTVQLARSHGNYLPRHGGKSETDEWVWNYQATYYAADGSVVDWYNGDWDAVVRLVVNWDLRYTWGADDGADFIWYSAGSGHGHDDLNGIGADSPVSILNGTASDSTSYHYRFVMPDYVYAWDSIGQSRWEETHQDVRWSNSYDYETGIGLYPLSGVSSYVVHDRWIHYWSDSYGDTTENMDFDGAVRVTFNGTRYVPIVVDERYSFTLDLDTGEILDETGSPILKQAPRRR